MDSKKPWQSKTIIVNSLIGVCLALSPFIPSLSVVSEFIKQNVVSVGVVWSVLSILLRSVSKGQIQLGD